MGTRITVGDWPFEAISYEVTEEATPIAGDDTAGSVGRITFDISIPDPDLTYVANRGANAVQTFGPDILLDRPIQLADSRKGFTLGTVIGVNRNDDGATLSLTCSTRLSLLNAYGIQAQPYVGTLEGAFDYYLSLVGISTDYFIDPLVAERPVVFPGWTGELWFHLKQIAIAQDCDISLVSGVILLRPIRQRDSVRGRDISRGRDLSPPTLARAVEVYQYNNVPITEHLVYPPGGWVPETEVLNVNAGEEATYTLELSASVSSIQPPTHLNFVGQYHDYSSVYTVVANDGFPVSAAAWTAQGGSVEVRILEDTRTLEVKLRGATGLPLTSGGPATNFSLGLGSDVTGNRYSTLRIVGTGVMFTKEKKRVRTGVPDIKTGTDVGVTIDNPFISTHEDFCRAGTRAAKRFAGPVPTISGNILSINRRGDSGDMTLPEYAQVEDALDASLGEVATYGQVQSFYVSQGLTTYGQVQDFWYDYVRNDYDSQVFGNVNGTRVWDSSSRRWYRIRTGGSTPEGIRFDGEDDLTHFDVEGFYITETYGSLQAIFPGMTYRQVELAGLYRG